MSRSIVEEVLSKRAVMELWTAGYRPALPISPQDFAMSGVLPMMLYLMRWGHRRGRGRFQEVYGCDGKPATVTSVADVLGRRDDWFTGVDKGVPHAILADLLLAFCLENRGHAEGRDQQVQRVYPTHYFCSWVDLPSSSGHLRYVPELLTLLLKPGGHFEVGTGFEANLLLKTFGPGTSVRDGPATAASLNADVFDERCEVGIDQLLTIRLAQHLGEAPLRLKGQGSSPVIPKQRPAALAAADVFFEDFNVFVRAYGGAIPRQSLLPMLESCLALGMTNTYLSTQGQLLHWARGGRAPATEEQKPWPLFVDASNGSNHNLRRHSEQSMDDAIDRLPRFAEIHMVLQVIHQWAGEERLPVPDPTNDPLSHLNFLGGLLDSDTEAGGEMARNLRRRCNRLADALREERLEVAAILEGQDAHPAWLLAEALVLLMGPRLQFSYFRHCLDCCMMADQVHGLSLRRKSTVGGQLKDRRSVVLTDTVLDFLVHRHLRAAAQRAHPQPLTFGGLLEILRENYGLFVDEAPPDMSTPGDHLLENRRLLERRLRDLGLLVGVNDAESMKRLRPRFGGN